MPELTVSEAILQRRSVKTFKSDPLPPDLLQRVIDLTLEAPSSFNLQPTRLVVIQSPEQKAALAAVAWGQKQITQAPVVFVFTVSIRGWESTMDQVLESAVKKGAWPEKLAEMIRTSAPGFQDALATHGLEREYAVKDALIAATTCALAAQSLGLGSCFMNGWDEAGVKKVLGVENDPDIAVALVLPVGYIEVAPGHPGRLPQSITVAHEKLA
ncbi:MAG: nitroreductase family protein [Candidatus Methylacidiphilales bacterium]|nr:nitroreductase family protein [Candidatus Methylacidiphilales bacterium]